MYNMFAKNNLRKEYHNMIIQLFNYIFQIIFSIFEKEFNNLNQIIFSKDNTIAKLNKTILILKDKIKELNTDNENLIICETSISPSYLPFEVDIAPLSVEVVKPTLNYKNLIKGKIFKTSKCVKDRTLPYPEQVCPKCSSPYEYHSRHSKNQKKCKCCNAHFNIEKMRKHTHNSFYCPYCKKALSLRAKRTSFDVYVCKNQKCSYRIEKKKTSKHHRDKISYIYRHINLQIDEIFNIIKDSKIVSKFSFYFKKFNMDIFSKALTIKVNLKQSNRNTAQAMKDLFGIEISHTQIANYCEYGAAFAALFNAHAPFKPSQNLVADETYIKINGKRHYVWIIYDRDKETVVSYHISNVRDTKACIVAIVKAINKYPELPKELNFASDAYTAYPLALQYVAKEYNIRIKHSFVKGLQIQTNEDSDTRIAKQQIERLNRTFKESYRITTGYGTLKGAIASFELWMLYYNYLRIKGDSTINSLEFIDKRINISNLLMPMKWTMIIKYIIQNYVT